MESKKKKKICKICKQEIKKEDNYIRLTEYKQGIEISTGYFHTTEFRKKFMDFAAIQERANKLLGTAEPILERFRGNLI